MFCITQFKQFAASVPAPRHALSRRFCTAARVLAIAAALTAFNDRLSAASLTIPNSSFESPATVFVDTNIDYWVKSPKPFWYDESANGPWAQLTGVFVNSAEGASDHIGNLDGQQAAFFFALPQVALSLDNLSSTNAFNAKFEPGKSYQLTVGVIGNGGGMKEGVMLQIGLYYLDANSNAVTVASTTVTNSNALFPNRTNVLDFTVAAPAVKDTDAWAGKNLGIQIVSATDFNLMGGYWDIDNVRLSSFQAPVLSGAQGVNGHFNLTLSSEPGLRFEVLASTNLTSDVSSWTSIATLTNTAGAVNYTDSVTGLPQRFYQVRQVP